MNTVDYVTADPPPTKRQRDDTTVARLAAIVDVEHGEWVRFDPVPKKIAEGRAVALKLRGYDAVTRSEGNGQSSLYARTRP